MKKIYFAAAIVAAACTGQVPADQCEVEFCLDNMNDTMCVMMFNADMGDTEVCDTIVAQDGKMTYTATLDEARTAYIVSIDKTKALSFYLLPGNRLTLTGDMEGTYHMTGSKVYDEIDAALSVTDDLQDKMRALQQEYSQRIEAGENADSVQADVMERYQKVAEQMTAKQTEYIEQNPGSLGAVLLLTGMQGEEFEKYDAIVTDEAKQGELAGIYKQSKARWEKEQARATAKKALDEGGEAPNFTLTTIDGKQFTLSSLRGKYVVIDFWGSWCGWCIKGMPDMKKYYEKYAGRIEIVGVDCNDSDEAWRAAVEKHALPWLHVKNGEGDQDITTVYAVEGYPTKLIINPEGKVVKYIVGEDPTFYTVLDEIMN